MVSGFFTSPNDHDRIMSGDARPMRIASKSSTSNCCFRCLRRSRIAFTACHPAPWGAVLVPCCCWAGTGSVLLELDVDRERADLLDQDVERLRHAGFHPVVAVDDVLVHLGPAVHVIRLD